MTSDSPTSSIAAVYDKLDNGQRGKNKEFSQTKCSICVQKPHPRFKWPAKHTSCLIFNKTGHWAVVCRSATAAIQPEEIPDDEAFPLAILMCATNSHEHSRIFEQIGLDEECVEVKALIDPGPTISFIIENFCNSKSLDARKSQRNSRLANGDKLKNVPFCDTLLTIQNKFYAVKLAVVKSVICDLIIESDVLSQHSKVSLHFGGKEDTVGFSVLAATLSEPVCLFSKMNIEPSVFFDDSVYSARPITTKSRWCNPRRSGVHED